MPPNNWRWSSLWLALRSILWTILMPGVIAGYIPWRFYGVAHVHITLANPVHILAVVMLGLGTAMLSACIWEFARSGRGTLSPVDPPRELVVRGLYRYLRNPMYLSVTMIVLGEVLLAGSRGLFIYWVVFFSAANLFMIRYEEPNLRRRFGVSYERYTQLVGRWIPRLGARGGEEE
jgi:protein-S-isoprenylcysteine O-methyltransferase Ste14